MLKYKRRTEVIYPYFMQWHRQKKTLGFIIVSIIFIENPFSSQENCLCRMSQEASIFVYISIYMIGGNLKSSKQSLVNYSLSKQQYISTNQSQDTEAIYEKVYLCYSRQRKKVCSVLQKRKFLINMYSQLDKKKKKTWADWKVDLVNS